MTSKISLTNKKTGKQQIYTVFLQLVEIFLLGAYAIRLHNLSIMTDYANDAAKTAALTESLLPDFPTCFFCMLAGFLLALQSFEYLSKKSEEDLYFSLPLDRKTMFRQIILRDVKQMFFFCGSLMLFEFILALPYHVSVGKAVLYAAFTLGCMLLAGAFTYLTQALCLLLTGHALVGALAFLTALVYFPMVVAYIHQFLAGAFFVTYRTGEAICSFWHYLSPVYYCFRLMLSESPYPWKAAGHLTDVLAGIVVILILYLLVRKLFLIRKTEAAGNALAFENTKPLIRILIVIPCSFYIGIFFRDAISDGATWLIFVGTLIGSVLLHGLMESIYSFDVKHAFAHKRQLLACVAVSFLVLSVYQFDLLGFDSYAPESEKLASVSLADSSLGYTSNINPDWGVVSGEKMDLLLENLKPFAADAKERYQMSMQGTRNSEGEALDNSINVSYRLKNGKDKWRVYYVSNTELQKIAGILLDSKEYKESSNQLLKLTASQIENFNLETPFFSEELKLNEKETEKLLSLYRKEFLALDAEAARDNHACTILYVYARNRNDAVFTGNAFGNSYMYTSETLRFTLYPTFTETLSYLEELGYHPLFSMADLDLKSVHWTSYDENDREVVHQVKNPELLAKYTPYFYWDMTYEISNWVFGRDTRTYVDVNASDGATGRTSSFSCYVEEKVLEELETAEK